MLLLKFAYDGTKYYGFQRQPSVPTVEGKIIDVLKSSNIATTIKSASRTDRGVSALGNVILVDSEEAPNKVIGILNSKLKHIYFHSYSERDINPRHAKMRWYRYHLPDMGYDIDILREAATLFVGEHDFKNFTKVRSNTTLTIDAIEVTKKSDYFIIDFFAQYYLWNLIRRIVGAITAYASGTCFGKEIFSEPRNFAIAPPEPLILMDVDYGFEFKKIRESRRFKMTMYREFSKSLIYMYLFKGSAVFSPEIISQY